MSGYWLDERYEAMLLHVHQAEHDGSQTSTCWHCRNEANPVSGELMPGDEQ